MALGWELGATLGAILGLALGERLGAELGAALGSAQIAVILKLSTPYDSKPITKRPA